MVRNTYTKGCIYTNPYDIYDWDLYGWPGEFVYGDDVYVPDDYMEERWFPVVGYPDYWVSNMERVWSSIKQQFNEGNRQPSGYVDFTLKRPNGTRGRKHLHHMMAEAFIPNPLDLPFVRHLDDNPWNNDLDNLAWGTQKDNVQDCIRNGHFRYFTAVDYEKAMQKRRMGIVAINLKTKERYLFASQQEAARILGIPQADISAVIRDIKQHVRSWYFTKQGEDTSDLPDIDLRYHQKKPRILAINKYTDEKIEYEGLTRAAEELDMSVSSVSMVLHEKMAAAKGWTFKYLDD